MQNILKIAHWEYMTRIRSKWFIISTILLPIIMVGLMLIPSLLISVDDIQTKIIAIVDESANLGVKVKQELIEKYILSDGSSKFQVVLLENQTTNQLIEVAAELLESETISAYLVIPEFVMKENFIKYFSKNLSGLKDREQIKNALNTVISRERMLAADLNPDEIVRLTREVDFKIFEIREQGVEKEESEVASFLTPIIFVMMLFFAIFTTAQILLRSVLEERRNRLVEILLSSISSNELMAGKILGLGLLGLTQLIFYLFVVLTISFYRGIEIVTLTKIILFLIYFIFGYMLYASIFAAVGSIFDSEQEAQQVTSILSLVTILPIMLSSFVISNPHAPLTIGLSFIPIVTPFFMILRIGIEMPPLWEICGTMAILIFTVVFVMWAAGRIFRVAILLYGKKLSLSEIIQCIRVK